CRPDRRSLTPTNPTATTSAGGASPSVIASSADRRSRQWLSANSVELVNCEMTDQTRTGPRIARRTPIAGLKSIGIARQAKAIPGSAINRASGFAQRRTFGGTDQACPRAGVLESPHRQAGDPSIHRPAPRGSDMSEPLEDNSAKDPRRLPRRTHSSVPARVAGVARRTGPGSRRRDPSRHERALAQRIAMASCSLWIPVWSKLPMLWLLNLCRWAWAATGLPASPDPERAHWQPWQVSSAHSAWSPGR
ncbi:MAG: hypothetical protein QOG82_634, partial [Actinomycetota bacterium]|nr:hypothetical protein [Actinomycetota bacterium]